MPLRNSSTGAGARLKRRGARVGQLPTCTLSSPRTFPIFRATAACFAKTQELGALKQGSWGAAAYEGFEPLDGEIFVSGNANSAFRRTGLEDLLRDRAVKRINVMGLATQFSVEHTVRDAADMGYSVRLFADCCISGDLKAHRASLRTLTMLADVVDSAAVFED